MIKHNQVGGVSGLGISLVMAIILLVASIAFGVWAFGSRQDYKNNVDAKISTAVTAAKAQAAITETAQLAQDEKRPLNTYNGPPQYGSIVLQYPRTWSGYVDTTDTNNTALLDGYFAPGVVPSISNQASVFAVHIQILNQAYAQAVQALTSQAGGTTPVTSTVYALPKLPNIVGVELNGQLQTGQTDNVTMVVLPMRADTIEISTVGSTYLGDFNNIVLKNFSFSP